MTAADAPELTTRDCKDWALAYADLAAKLAAAERERDVLQSQIDEMARIAKARERNLAAATEARDSYLRIAHRAEAALVAAQEQLAITENALEVAENTAVEQITKHRARIEALEQALRAIQRAHDANSSDSAALAQIHRIVRAALAQTGEPTG